MTKKNMLTDIKRAKQARAAYMRAWRKKNPEKAQAIQHRYWLKRAEQLEKQA